MTTLKGYSSILKTLLFALSIALALPTIASASQTNSQTQTKANYYKKQAQKNLKIYNECYQYKYYQKYLHYMKKYRNLMHPRVTIKTCERYGKLADRYEEAYEKYGYKIYKRYTNFYKKRESWCQAIVNKEGTVIGKVILDNGGEGNNKPLAGVEVKIVDAKGKVTTVKTNKRGYYKARNIAKGEANVTIVNPQYQNKTLIQSIGENPSSVKVRPFRRNWAKRDGYTYVTSLALQTQEVSLNKGTTTTVEVTGTYSNATSRDDTNNSTYTIDPSTIASIVGNTLAALSDGNTNITAKIDGVTSNIVNLEVYWEVNGHRLPPKPDEALNNSTLLGIDTNSNGVRDDVERFVYEKYKDDIYSKEKIAIAMQYGWAYQKIIETPTKESMKYQDDAIDCEWYWLGKESADLPIAEDTQWTIKHRIYTDTFKSLIYNTKERAKQYFKYNGTLSGGVFPGRLRSVDNCQVNIDELGEK